MTSDDRDLLVSLRRQQEELRQALEKLNAQLGGLENRAAREAVEIPHVLPPLPPEHALPPVPPLAEPVPAALEFPSLPATPGAASLPPAPKPSIEFQFGRWLTRIGALFFVLSIVFFATWVDVKYSLHERIGPGGKLGLMGLASVLVVALGQRLERPKANLLFFGRTLMAAGLAGLYFTFYASYYVEPLRVVGSPLIPGLLLFLWSLYVLLLAERRHSQILGVFSITLAYVSTAINPVGAFTMGADLLLAATAVVFLLRNGWTTLSTLSLIGTYLAALRRLVFDENGEFVIETRSTLNFWPYVVYLAGAWLIFTVAGILTASPTFRGGKRLAFISLNNGAVAGLLALAAYVAGFGPSAIGWTMIDTGLVFLITSRFAEMAQIDPVSVMGAYAAQGLALITGGIMVVYTGLTRGVLLLIETFFLGIAAAFSGDRILTISTYVSAFFATLFLIWEIAVNAHHPWMLGFGGAAVMFINAWASRGEVRNSPVARSTIVLSSSCYCVFALGLIYTALSTELSDTALPPALAFTALVLTFSIYYFALYELPPLAQTLLLAAQALVLFPAETGEELPWQGTAWVAAITLLLITWWARQRITRSGPWTILLTFLYALALAALAHQEVRPYLDAQGWMIGASLLSFIFLVYGAFSRVWAISAVGQIFLALAVYHFFFPPNQDIFPWSWWAAAVPGMVVLATARAAQAWLRLFREIPESWRVPLKFLACCYYLLALLALIRWVSGIIVEQEQIAAYLFLGTLVLSSSVRRASAFGVRCSFVLSLLGVVLYFTKVDPFTQTILNGFGLFLLLAQIPLLRHEGRSLISKVESWALVILSVAAAWLFVSAWVSYLPLYKGQDVFALFHSPYLTLAWALYALFLFLFGLVVQEPRLRWCGLGVVLAAILRVLGHDMWTMASGYRVLTFVALAFITLGIGYIILRRAAPRASTE